MLEGITVLNQCEILRDNSIWFVPMVMFIAIAIISFIIGLVAENVLFMVIAFVSIVPIVFFATIANQIIPTGKYTYEVTIADSVNMKEFYDHYEIVDRRGDIFKIKDKETEE